MSVWGRFVAGWKSVANEFGLTRRFALVVAGAALLVGGVLLAYYIHNKRYAKNGPGELRVAHLATLDDGRNVVVLAVAVHHGHSGGRYSPGGSRRSVRPRALTSTSTALRCRRSPPRSL